MLGAVRGGRYELLGATKRILSVRPDIPVKISTNQLSLIQNDKLNSNLSKKRNLSMRKLRNNRDNEGFLNKSIRITSTLSRSAVTNSAGTIDERFGTNYASKIFTFQSDFVKGFWRWYDAMYDVWNVVRRLSGIELLLLEIPKPRYYREHVNFGLFFNSLRGLPIICCGFVPGGFVLLGGSLVMLPSDVVLPRTFWNRSQIAKFIDEQHKQRKTSRWEVMDYLRRQSVCVDPINAFNKESELYQLAETLKPMFEMEQDGSRHFLSFNKLKPFCQSGNILSLEKLPLRTLQALAKGHGLYYSAKLSQWLPSETISKLLLQHVLNRIVNRIQTQDRMIKRELLIGFMTQRELDWACYRRGFNPHGKHRFEQESFLREWLRRSHQIDSTTEPSEMLFNIALLPRSQKLRASCDNTEDNPIEPSYY